MHKKKTETRKTETNKHYAGHRPKPDEHMTKEKKEKRKEIPTNDKKKLT